MLWSTPDDFSQLREISGPIEGKRDAYLPLDLDLLGPQESRTIDVDGAVRERGVQGVFEGELNSAIRLHLSLTQDLEEEKEVEMEVVWKWDMDDMDSKRPK